MNQADVQESLERVADGVVKTNCAMGTFTISETDIQKNVCSYVVGGGDQRLLIAHTQALRALADDIESKLLSQLGEDKFQELLANFRKGTTKKAEKDEYHQGPLD